MDAKYDIMQVYVADCKNKIKIMELGLSLLYDFSAFFAKVKIYGF